MSEWINLKHFCPWISLVENIPIALASAAPTHQLGQGVIYQGQPVGKECSQRVLECCCQWAQTVYCNKQPAKPFSDEDELCALPCLTDVFSRCFLLSPQHLLSCFSSLLLQRPQIAPACLLFFHWYLTLVLFSLSHVNLWRYSHFFLSCTSPVTVCTSRHHN